MQYLDTHCHIDQYAKPMEALKRAEQAGVVTIAVTELPSRFQRLALRLGSRRLVRVAVGIHPLQAAAATPLELALFAQMLDRTDYVGEVGLDRSAAGRPSYQKQLKVFEHLLQLPQLHRKVLTVHSRGAEQDTIDRLSQAGVAAILHWYSGPLKLIDSALAAGLWFSVNPAMLRSKRGQRIVTALPPERVLTETDGPYAKVGGRSAEPSDIPGVVNRLARVWREDPAAAHARIFNNMTALAASSRMTKVGCSS